MGWLGDCQARFAAADLEEKRDCSGYFVSSGGRRIV